MTISRSEVFFYLKFIVMGSVQKEGGEGGNMQGTQEHDDMTRAKLLLWERGEKTRAGAGVEEGRGDTVAAFPHPQEAPLVTGSPPLRWLPKIPSLLFCLWP